MTGAQWYIYKYIKDNSENDKWVKQKDIQEYLLKEKNMQLNQRTIRKYINLIRKDEQIQKVILTDYQKGYKIMNDKEQFCYLINRKNSILKMLKSCYRDIKRFNNNNQYKITFSDYERNIFESLLKIKEKGGGQ